MWPFKKKTPPTPEPRKYHHSFVVDPRLERQERGARKPRELGFQSVRALTAEEIKVISAALLSGSVCEIPADLRLDRRTTIYGPVDSVLWLSFNRDEP